MGHGWVKEERQESSGQNKNDEGVQCYFTKKEGPMVWEQFAPKLFNNFGGAHAGIYKISDLPCLGRSLIVLNDGHYAPRSSAGLGSRSQYAGPTGSWKPLCATRQPSLSKVLGSCGSGCDARLKTTLHS